MSQLPELWRWASGLPVRVRRALDMLKPADIPSLCRISEAEFLSVPNFGVTSLCALNVALRELGLAVGMSDVDLAQAIEQLGRRDLVEAKVQWLLEADDDALCRFANTSDMRRKAELQDDVRALVLALMRARATT